MWGRGGGDWAIFRGMIFFLTVRLFIMGNGLCKKCFKSNTVPGHWKALARFFNPWLPLHDFFQTVFAVQEFIWEIAQTFPPPMNRSRQLLKIRKVNYKL